jgi:hypothetical protein
VLDLSVNRVAVRDDCLDDLARLVGYGRGGLLIGEATLKRVTGGVLSEVGFEDGAKRELACLALLIM